MTHEEPDSRVKIWQIIAAIPVGRVMTYGGVARLAGLGKAARMVGRTLKQLPAGTTLPWHRVINAQGRISFPAGSNAYQRQAGLLEAEGITIPSSGRISLPAYGWPDKEY